MEASNIGQKRKTWLILIPSIIILVLLFGAVVGFTVVRNSAGSNVMTESMAEPLNGATAGKFDINTGTGNLTIDSLIGSEQLLVSGALQYLESQGLPTWSVDTSKGQVTFILKARGGRQPGFQLPWAAYNGETEWLIHINPNLPSDITVYSGGGNVKLNLAGMVLTRLAADTAGGNMEVVLPGNAADLNVNASSSAGNVTVTVGSGITGSSTINASSGAGNVVVHLPSGSTARIHATTGLGKLTIDTQFIKIDENTYQSPDYDSAANTVDVTVGSGAGDVSVITQ